MNKLSYEEKIKIYEERKQGRTANSLAKKYEDNLREHSNKVRNLKKKIKTRDDRIEELEYDLNDKGKEMTLYVEERNYEFLLVVYKY